MTTLPNEQTEAPAEPVESADDAIVEPAVLDDGAGEEDLEQSRRRALMQVFLRTARGFWGGQGDRLAWMLTIGLLVVVLLSLGVQYGINLWNRYIFDALAERDAKTVAVMSAIFLPLAASGVAFGVTAVYMRMTLQRRWRAWVNANVVDRWLARGRYYQLNLARTRNTASLRTCASPPIRRSISSPPSSPPRFRSRPSPACCGSWAAI
jgi:putative ATP-binding cassette transporter